MAQPFRNFSLRPLLARLSLTALAITLTLAAAACAAAASQPDPAADSAAPPAAAAQQTAAVPAQIPVRSRLVFPRKAELSFAAAGEIDQILVAPGDRVAQGQLLARLNSDHFPALDAELARLRYDVSQTRDTIRQLRLDFSTEPLLAARRAETIAGLEYANLQTADLLDDINQNYDDALTAARQSRDQAILDLDLAQDNLAQAQLDLEADHQQVLAQAFQARADAELALDNAQQRLDDYTDNLPDDAVRGQARVAAAELALNLAQEALQDYRENFPDDAVRAQDRVTAAELALDQAQDALTDFIDEHARQILRARTRVGAAEVARDAADDAVSEFIRDPILDRRDETQNFDNDILQRRQARAALAQAELEQAQEDLAELEAGPDPLRLEELRSNITVAELNLSQAQEDLAELEAGPDPLRLEELRANITVAEVNLSRAQEDLTELEEGPDPLIVKELQTTVDLARVVLSQAEKNLAEELEGPDRLNLRRLSLAVELSQTRLDLAERELNELLSDGPDRDAVPLRAAEIAARTAQIADLDAAPDALQIAALDAAILQSLERMDDILEEMENAELRSPFAGVVYLVNAQVDDRVSKDSRVLEIIDPAQAEIAGLVEANAAPFVQVGNPAQVSIASLPGVELTGVVTALSAEPGTERGIISYPVTIRVNLPPGVELPPRLSAVTSVITP